MGLVGSKNNKQKESFRVALVSEVKNGDKSLYSRLRRLFSTNVIVRNVGGKKLKVADAAQIQVTTKSHLVDRYSKLHSGLDLVNSGYSTFAQLQA